MDDGKPHSAMQNEADDRGRADIDAAAKERAASADALSQAEQPAAAPSLAAADQDAAKDAYSASDDAASAYISDTKPPRAEAPIPPPSSDFQGATTPDGILSTDSDDPFLRDIIAALKTVYDPEIPADIYELGLIYAVDVDDDRNVVVTMTLTAPGCPVAGEMPKWVENAVNAVPGVANTSVTMTFDPPWDMGRMSDEARLALNMF